MKKILWVLLFIIGGLLFHKFLLSLHPIIAVDYTHLENQIIQYYRNYAFSSWYPSDNLGISYIVLLNHAPSNFLVGLLGSIGIPDAFVERVLWWIPFFLLGGGSIYLLTRSVLRNTFAAIAIMLYMANTYVLMILAGGQVQGVGLAYALAPMILLCLRKVFSQILDDGRTQISWSVMYGILLGIEMVLDPRLTYIMLVASVIYGLVYMFFLMEKTNLFGRIIRFGIFGYMLPSIILGLLHMFWILPTVLAHANINSEFGSVFTSKDAVRYFSFAKFENTLGLLHPNWPENIFGKTYFMRPEFLLLPVFAFISLFWVKKTQGKKEYEKNIHILFFAILGIIGIFLAKGAQDPFGGVYLWMFDHVPGFVMFRDPTKWYLLIAISYAILIPFTIGKVYVWFKDKVKIPHIQNLFVVLVVGYLLFLIRPAFLGQLGGTFQTHVISWEYQKFSKDLTNDKAFGRILWVPSPQQNAFSSPFHSKISSLDLFQKTNTTDILQEFTKHSTQRLLQEIGVKYVVVPYDSEKEIFLKDRKYDPQQYAATVHSLQQIPWLKQAHGYGQLAVFEVSNPHDHFWITDTNATVSYHVVSPTEYDLSVKHVKKGDQLIFAESFNSQWVLQTTAGNLRSQPYQKILNSFVVPIGGSFTGRVIFMPQEWVEIGIWISSITIFVLCIYLLVTSFKQRKK